MYEQQAPLFIFERYGSKEVANDYKNTMNLPQTEFPMRGNLAQNEPKRLEKWYAEDLYWKVLDKNKDGKPFVLHDGPPYANGPIHIGHSFNKILKDFVNKSHAQRGYYTPYIPGWDCHGQPIEHMVEKTLGPKKMSETSLPKLRELCRDWATEYVNVQREGFKRLGVNADWEHPYLTYTPDYEAGNVELFKDMYLKGSIYRGRKPIHWCVRCHTALAEAEIEYGDEVSPSIFVAFKLDNVPGVFEAAGVEDAYILIWTTTPWTLPANTAVSLAPEARYVIVQAQGKNMLMAEDLIEQVAEKAGWENYTIVSDDKGEPISLTGKELYGLTYTAPIRQDLKGTVIYGDHVTLDTGTGAVHTAPGHGQDDYLVGLEFDIPLLMPVDDNGVLTDEAGQFAGLSVNDANPKIIEWLKEQGVLIAQEDINHSYPHCWRCHEPVIFRATDQWFVSMDKNSLREDALIAIDKEVEWIPAWAKNRISAMVADRPDWCISRQRSWGVPIPVFKCAKCNETIADEATFDAVIDLFKTHGSDAWFTTDPSTYLPSNTKCPKCGGTEFVPEKDILDVWWESGVSHTSVLKHREDEGMRFPADMYLEGSDQHRGWFQSSLLTSVGAYGVPPYKAVMHCGFTVDEDGRKMSKSLGNGIDPDEICDSFGADVLRLWVSSVDYSQDVSISKNILKQVSDAYRRIRNTFRFLLGNLDDFDAKTDAIDDFSQLEPIDQYMMIKTAKLLEDVEKAYEDYKFNSVYRLVYDFVNDLSAVYMDVSKDRLYSESANSPRRRAVQTVLMNITDVLVRVMAPILSFTCDEVWEYYPQGMRLEPEHPFSVQLAGWPERSDFVPTLPDKDASQHIYDIFESIMDVRDAVTKALEGARDAGTINKSQEADVALQVPQSLIQKLETIGTEALADLFIVSQVKMSIRPDDSEEISVEITPSSLQKCERCWNYREIGVVEGYPDICERCSEVMENQKIAGE